MGKQKKRKVTSAQEKKIEKAAEVKRSVSKKIPHPGLGGRSKKAIVNEYKEPKSSLNLSLTATAKLRLKQEWSVKYKLPLTDVFEQIARSDECMEAVPEILNLEERSEEIRQLRAEAKKRGK